MEAMKRLESKLDREVPCTFALYEDHTGKTGGRATSERLLQWSSWGQWKPELSFCSKREERIEMRDSADLESTGLGDWLAVEWEVKSGSWMSPDFWIGWCWHLHWDGGQERRSWCGRVVRSSIWDPWFGGPWDPQVELVVWEEVWWKEPILTRESQSGDPLGKGDERRIDDEVGRTRVRKKNLVVSSWF